MSDLPPREWFEGRLPPKLDGAAGDAFIGTLADEDGYQRLAYDLGFARALELALTAEPAAAEVRRLRLVGTGDAADELLEPTRFVDSRDLSDTEPSPPAGPEAA